MTKNSYKTGPNELGYFGEGNSAMGGMAVGETLMPALHELSKGFDVTYLLSRKNLKECVDSWAYLNHNRGNIDFETEYHWEKTPNYNVCFNEIHRWNTKLKTLSEKLNQTIIYYEDIFDTNNNRLRKGDKPFDKKII